MARKAKSKKVSIDLWISSGDDGWIYQVNWLNDAGEKQSEHYVNEASAESYLDYKKQLGYKDVHMTLIALRLK